MATRTVGNGQTVQVDAAELGALMTELKALRSEKGNGANRKPKAYNLTLEFKDKGNGEYAVVHGAGRSRFIGFKAHVAAMVEQGILDELREWAES